MTLILVGIAVAMIWLPQGTARALPPPQIDRVPDTGAAPPLQEILTGRKPSTAGSKDNTSADASPLPPATSVEDLETEYSESVARANYITDQLEKLADSANPQSPEKYHLLISMSIATILDATGSYQELPRVDLDALQGDHPVATHRDPNKSSFSLNNRVYQFDPIEFPVHGMLNDFFNGGSSGMTPEFERLIVESANEALDILSR